jgi:hypothetical protein
MHKRINFRQGAVAAFLLVAGQGCGLEPVGEGGDADELPAAVQQAFDESCATSPGCHADGAPQVVLSAPASVEILSKTSSSGGGPLVVLGNVEESYLAQKILGGSNITGATMPPSPQSDRDDINAAIIVGWIAGVPLEGPGDGDGDGDGGDGDGDGDGDPPPVCYIEAPLPATPSFEADIWPILENRCGIMGCHANFSAPLMPDAMTAYDNLVGMPADAAALDYIEPSAPDMSYLWHKMLGTQATVMGGTGSTMPLGPAPCTIELQAIYAWITTGAEL